MSTERQIAANRLNAQKSTGPRTEEGRAAVRLNAVKHGLCAKTLVLPGEDESEFHALVDDLAETFQPADRNEALLVRQMAIAAWCLDRAYHAEGALFHYELKDDAQIRDKYHPGLDLHGQIAYLLQDSSNHGKLSLAMRYQSHHQRAYDRALRSLERLQAKRTATVRERPLREQQPSRDESESQQPTANSQQPPFGSVSQKRRQPIPINLIKNIESEPTPAAESGSQPPIANSQKPPSSPPPPDKNA